MVCSAATKRPGMSCVWKLLADCFSVFHDLPADIAQLVLFCVTFIVGVCCRHCAAKCTLFVYCNRGKQLNNVTIYGVGSK